MRSRLKVMIGFRKHNHPSREDTVWYLISMIVFTPMLVLVIYLWIDSYPHDMIGMILNLLFGAIILVSMITLTVSYLAYFKKK